MDSKELVDFIKPIYSRLQDEESTHIFMNRLLYNITDDYLYIKNIVDCLPESKVVRDIISQHDEQPKVLFGAGTWGRRFQYVFSDIDWKCYVDNKLFGQEINGLPVLSLDEMLSRYSNAFIIVSTRFFHDEIEHQLREQGVAENNIVYFDDLMYKLFGSQYFDLPELEHDENEVFVDVGGYDGQTTLDFLRWSKNKYKKIFIFEPNAVMTNQIKDALENVNKYEIIDSGCWNQAGLLEFVEDKEKEMASHFVANSNLRSENNFVKVDTIDRVLGDEKATFIKMDIEGAELQAIIGAESQIIKNKPKCAISVYHKPEDIWEIPLKLLEYRPDYKFYLRQYSLTIAELILYAI